VLRAGNEFLEALLSEFADMIRELQRDGRAIDINCFYEELPMPVVGYVVPKKYAIFDGHPHFSIRANHRDMVRFSSSDETGFKRLIGELRTWVKSCEPQIVQQLGTSPGE
jgi:protein SERAC1